eukprot:scaffold14_cov279-Pinguiococcus_pyrenoidosus.AAC.2
MPTAPNSFSITAIRLPCIAVKMWFNRVVLPLPRKPVRTVTGILDGSKSVYSRPAAMSDPPKPLKDPGAVVRSLRSSRIMVRAALKTEKAYATAEFGEQGLHNALCAFCTPRQWHKLEALRLSERRYET